MRRTGSWRAALLLCGVVQLVWACGSDGDDDSMSQGGASGDAGQGGDPGSATGGVSGRAGRAGVGAGGDRAGAGSGGDGNVGGGDAGTGNAGAGDGPGGGDGLGGGGDGFGGGGGDGRGGDSAGGSDGGVECSPRCIPSGTYVVQVSSRSSCYEGAVRQSGPALDEVLEIAIQEDGDSYQISIVPSVTYFSGIDLPSSPITALGTAEGFTANASVTCYGIASGVPESGSLRVDGDCGSATLRVAIDCGREEACDEFIAYELDATHSVGEARCALCAGLETEIGEDETNCGACGSVCSGVCRFSRCVETMGAGPVRSVAVDAANVYWLEHDPAVLYKRPKSGGSAVQLASGFALPVRSANILAVDATHVYWSAHTSLMRVPIAGGTPAAIASGQSQIAGVALTVSHAYFTDHDQDTVRRVPLAGGTAELVAAAQDAPTAIAVDANNVYWKTWFGPQADAQGNRGTVMRLPLGGGTPVPLATMQSRESFLAVRGSNAYWVHDSVPFRQEGTALVSAPITGGGATTLATDRNGITDIAVDATHAYWTNRMGIVQRVLLGGGTPELVAADLRGITVASEGHLALDATSVYSGYVDLRRITPK